LLFTPICFSPAIIRWPLGSTPMTVAVMVPEKSLVFSVAPLPSKVLADSPSADAREGARADARQRADGGRDAAGLADGALARLRRRSRARRSTR
jgi:hypothetical protein